MKKRRKKKLLPKRGSHESQRRSQTREQANKRQTHRVASAFRRKAVKDVKSAPRTLIGNVEVEELDSVREQLERLARQSAPPRWNADPEDVRRSVAKLVLTLVEFIRQLLERQAIRRMDAGTLTPEQTEAVGLALMRLEETVRDIGNQFGLEPEDLNFDLGPVGKLV